MNLQMATTLWASSSCKDGHGVCTCGCELTTGDAVVAPGLQGRGVITKRRGHMVEITYRSGLVVERHQRDVQKI